MSPFDRAHIDCAVPKGSKRPFCHFLFFRDYDTTADNTSPVKFLEVNCVWKWFFDV